MYKKALVVLSGGQDSTTCLFWALRWYDEVHAITFNYGQRHDREILAAMKVAVAAQVASHEIIALPDLLQGTSPLVNKFADVERYQSADTLPGGIEKTFVPMRNTLFLTIAANRAVVKGCFDIITGVSQEDFGGYPDCREDFIRSLQGTFRLSLEGITGINIVTPLIHLNKKETVLMAKDLGEECWNALAMSHTCYNGDTPPCGHCHACLLRAKGFDEAGLPDPLLERSR